MDYKRAHKSRWKTCFGLFLAGITLVIHWYAPAALVEGLYGKGLFRWVRMALDHTIALLPIPFFYVLVVLLAYLLARIVKGVRLIRKLNFRDFVRISLRFLNFLGWIVFAFYWLWGFNYDRVPLEGKLSWEQEAYTNVEFENESIEALQRLSDLRQMHSTDIQSALENFDYSDLESKLRRETSKVAQQIGYVSSNNIRCRSLLPKGVLLRFGTAGFYNPFTGECNIDDGLHTLQKPFVMAHEFFHGLGVSGEGDCNFLAYITCIQSTDPFIKYSGQLGYWRYLRRGFFKSDPDKYEEQLSLVSESVIQDLAEIDAAIRRYPDLAPRMRDAMYTAYLKTNKIEDGMANYHQIVPLVMAWRANGLKL